METIPLKLFERPSLNTEVHPSLIKDNEKIVSDNCNYDKKSLRSKKSNVESFMLTNENEDEKITFINKFKNFNDIVKTYLGTDAGKVYDIGSRITKVSGLDSKINQAEEFQDIIPLCDGSNEPKKIWTPSGDISKLGIDFPPTPLSVSLEQLLIDACETNNWTACNNVTASLDEQNYKKGSRSVKFEITEEHDASNVVAFNLFSSPIDLSSYEAIKFYLRSSIDLNQSSFTIHLYSSSNDICANDPYIVTIQTGTILAYAWTPVSVVFPDPSILTSVVAMSIFQSSIDMGACNLWIDYIYASTDGNLDGEAYFYKVNFYNSITLKESSASGIFPDDDIGLECISEKSSISDIPVSLDSQVDKVQLWRIGGISTVWRLVATVDNGITTYVDDIADDDLGVIFEADYNDPPPVLTQIKKHYNILFGFGDPDNKTRIYWSEVNEPEYWGDGTSNYRDIGEVPTGHEKFGRSFVLFTENSIWAKEGETNVNSGFYWRQTGVGIGNVPLNAVAFFRAPIFVWWDGIYWFDGEDAIKLSRAIDNFFRDSVNRDKLAEAFAVVYDEQYRLAICTGSNIYPDKVIILDFRNIATEGLPRIRIENFTIHSMYADKYTGYLYGGFENKLKLMENGFTESVALVDQSKYFGLDFGGREISLKDLLSIYEAWIYVDTKNYDLSFKVYTDFELSFTYTVNTSSMQRVHIPISIRKKFTFISFRFEWTGIGEFELLDIMDLGVTLGK